MLDTHLKWKAICMRIGCCQKSTGKPPGNIWRNGEVPGELL